MNDARHDSHSSHLAYGMYVLALLIFGTNGILVSHITLASSQIVLFRTVIGGTLLVCLVQWTFVVVDFMRP